MTTDRTPVIFVTEDEAINAALQITPINWHYQTTGEIHVGDHVSVSGIKQELVVTKRLWAATPTGCVLRIYIEYA